MLLKKVFRIRQNKKKLIRNFKIKNFALGLESIFKKKKAKKNKT